MVAKSKAKKVEEPVLVAGTTTEESTKKVSKKVSKKSTEPVTSTPVETTPVENQVVDVTLTTDTSGLAETFSEFMTKFQGLVSQMASLKVDFKTLEKKAVREIKAAQKEKAKRKRKSGNRSPSGFVKPTLISSELAKFLGKPTGTEMARTEVTREINGYIREHSLQDKENGRKINPDKALASLLKIKNGDELTYFNLQRYMSPHFAKAGASSTTPTTTASA